MLNNQSSVQAQRPGSLRSLVLVAAMLLALLAVQASLAGPAYAAPTGTVMVQTQRMTGPSLNTVQRDWYYQRQVLSLTCYSRGQSVQGYYSPWLPNGGWDNLWYKVSDGYWVADVDINTGSNNPVTPAYPTNSKILDFVNLTRGQAWPNINGTYTGECVSLISQYLYRVHGIATGAWGNAVDYRAGGTGGNQLQARGFQWSTSTSFQDGDILVWGGGYGHIGIWHAGQVYDQNDARHTPARTANYSGSFANGFASGYLGRWRK